MQETLWEQYSQESNATANSDGNWVLRVAKMALRCRAERSGDPHCTGVSSAAETFTTSIYLMAIEHKLQPPARPMY